MPSAGLGCRDLGRTARRRVPDRDRSRPSQLPQDRRRRGRRRRRRRRPVRRATSRPRPSPARAATGRTSLRDVPDLRDGVVRLAAARRLPVPLVPAEPPAQPAPPQRRARRRRRCCPAGTTAWPPSSGPGDLVTLVRNHEENGSAVGRALRRRRAPRCTTRRRWAARPPCTSPATARCSTRSRASAGTQMNCSGGRMPWGSWVTCEETVNGYDVGDDFTRTAQPGQRAPRPFSTSRTPGCRRSTASSSRCRPTARRRRSRSRTPAGSRTSRSPATRKSGALYLSEDNFAFPSGFYKYVPPERPDADRPPRRRWHALDAQGRRARRTPTWRCTMANGTTYDVEWVEIDQPWLRLRQAGRRRRRRRTTNNEALSFVGNQGRAKGAAKFSRLEGTVDDRGWIYFTSTQGGGGHDPDPVRPGRAASARASGRSGPTTPASQSCTCSTSRPARTSSTSRTT